MKCAACGNPDCATLVERVWPGMRLSDSMWVCAPCALALDHAQTARNRFRELVLEALDSIDSKLWSIQCDTESLSRRR